MQLFFVLSLLSLAVSAYLVGEVVTLPGRERDRAVKRAANYGRHRVASTGLERLRFSERVIVPATASLARFAMRLNPRSNLDAIAIRLMAAGMGRSLTPTAFLAMKGGGALIGGIVGAVVALMLMAGELSAGKTVEPRSTGIS